MAEIEHKKMILEQKLPQLTREIQERICLLVADIDDLPDQPSKTEKEKIKECIQNLKTEIKVQDGGTGSLKHLMTAAMKLDENIDNVLILRRLVNELEVKRKASIAGLTIGTVCAAVGIGLIFVAPPVGVILAGVSTALCSVAITSGRITERRICKMIEERKRKLDN